MQVLAIRPEPFHPLCHLSIREVRDLRDGAEHNAPPRSPPVNPLSRKLDQGRREVRLLDTLRRELRRCPAGLKKNSYVLIPRPFFPRARTSEFTQDGGSGMRGRGGPWMHTPLPGPRKRTPDLDPTSEGRANPIRTLPFLTPTRGGSNPGSPWGGLKATPSSGPRRGGPLWSGPTHPLAIPKMGSQDGHPVLCKPTMSPRGQIVAADLEALRPPIVEPSEEPRLKDF